MTSHPVVPTTARGDGPDGLVRASNSAHGAGGDRSWLSYDAHLREAAAIVTDIVGYTDAQIAAAIEVIEAESRDHTLRDRAAKLKSTLHPTG